MVSKSKIFLVQIKDLDQSIYVREALNTDHVEKFANLMSEGTEFPPIIINRRNIVIDGRHRIAAAEMLGLPEITCVYEDLEDEAEIIARAHRLNEGGSLPPTQGDMEHAVSMLIIRKVTKKRVIELLGLPKGMATRFIESIEARIKQRALNQALNLVAKGDCTAEAAAAQFSVDSADLKAAIRRRRRTEKDSLGDSMRGIRSCYKSLTRRTKELVRKGTEMCLDGIVAVHRVETLIEEVHELRKAQQKTLDEAKRRFLATAATPEK